jgi:predicted Zn-dependent protease
MWLAIAALIQSAIAFELTESPQASELRWDQMPIQWELDSTDSPDHLNIQDQREAMVKAFGTWEKVSGTAVEFEDVTDDASENDNVVYWERNWTANPEMLALTSTISNSEGTIIGFSIALNAKHPHWSIDSDDGMDLQNALTHEVGHVLGLDHTEEREEATMFPSAEEGEHSKRDLHWDDKEGLRYLYPINTTKGLFEGLACSSTAAAPSALLAALPLFAIARRRRS